MQFDDDFECEDDRSGNSALHNGSLKSNFTIGNLYKGEEADGFDISHGGEWIYPINYPIRKYQKNIVTNALFKNTLVCLPTGLGKTFIAAVVMFNYHRWYPKHIVVFMAHSKPLVEQQVHACCDVMGICPSSIAVLNGNMVHSNRKKQWETKKIFFLTPQVFNNDLARGSIKAESIRCIVIDEAHKAVGNQAYCQVIRSIKPFNSRFRVLALSATPGDDMGMVREVIQNLMISHLELHNEEDPDIKPYLHKKTIETIVVKLDHQILEIKDLFLEAVKKYISPLVKSKVLPQSFSAINPFSLVLKQRQFKQNPNVPTELRGIMLSNFSVAISLFYALEELITYGMRSFLTKLKCLQSGEGSSNKIHHRIGSDNDIKSLIEHVDNILGPDLNVSFDVNSSLTRIFDEIDNIDIGPDIVYSHPKFFELEKVIQDHFASSNESTRAIVFCKSRQCTGEICNFLTRFRPVVKPMIFIGQSQTSFGIVTKGFNQTNQLIVMKKFREGVYNTLVATCVAEEGLDIGEVDLIVNFDSGKNSNTQVQRSGRTGRRRDGRVVNLVTEGKEEQNYNISISKGKKMSKQLAQDSTKLPFYAECPSLMPNGINPVCQEMYLTAKKPAEEEPKSKKRTIKVKNSRKSRDASVEDQAKKKIKGPAKDPENITLCLSTSNKKLPNKKNQKKRNFHESTIELNCKKLKIDSISNEGVGNLSLNNCCDIEIIEREKSEEPTMLLYNDDVKEKMEKSWESLSMGESKEKNLIVQFLRANNLSLEPKSKFSQLLNLRKYEKYVKSDEKSSADLATKMDALKNYTLSRTDFECLQKEELTVQNLTDYIIKSREKIFKIDAAKSNNLDVKEKEGEAPTDSLFSEEAEFIENIDPDEFLRPFEPYLSSSKPNMISSTPLRKDREKTVLKTLQSSTNTFGNFRSDSNFHNWDESDIFDLKDRFSPNHKLNTLPEKGSSSKKNATDLSVISITQALHIVNKEISNTSHINNKLDEENNKAFVESSPILFFSQKQKTAGNKFVPTSPVLTQKRSSSRKCLKFTESSPANDLFQNSAKVVEKSNTGVVEDFDSSDLFAETEIALLNFKKEMMESVKKSENNAINVEKEVLLSPAKSDSNSSIGTMAYDLGQMDLDPPSTSDNFSMLRKNSEHTLKKRKPFYDVMLSPKGNGSESHLKSDVEEQRENVHKKRFHQNFSLCVTNDSDKKQSLPPSVGKPEQADPKLTLVRTMGFDNPLLVNSIERKSPNFSKRECNNNSKSDEKPFICNFSLFGDDDYSESCVSVNSEKKKGNFTAQKSNKVDVINTYNDELSDSDIFVDNEFPKNDKSSYHIEKQVEKMSDEAELSEGTLEALKAVELYEKSEKLAINQTSCMNKLDLDSDDSDDIFLPKKRQVKELDQCKSSQSKTHKKANPRKKTKKGLPSATDFIQEEAVLSDHSKVSSDEENTSGLDEYDSSFVDEREVLTQAQNIDMTAKYLQSTKSPITARNGAFKKPNSEIEQQLNVFSQIGSEGESEYENDSFCVPEGEISEVQDISELELAELVLQNKKKTKRKDVSIAQNVKKKRKLRRVFQIGSDSSETEVEVTSSKPATSNNNPIDDLDIEELLNSPFSDETETCSVSKTTNVSVRPVIFVASRQIASAPEITTFLRAKWNVNIQVRSAPEADYIVSWRVGINRIPLSDFANGSPTAKSNLKEIIMTLSRNFQQQVLIVEDDKNKGLPATTGYNRLMWTKPSGKNLVKIIENGVKIIFSRSKDDTARILLLLCSEERNKGQYIDLDTEINAECERKMKFYNSLPGINIANAFRMTKKFSSISSFLKCCNSVHIMMKETGLREEDAVKVFQLMFVAPYS